jgi:hypothetical protein
MNEQAAGMDASGEGPPAEQDASTGGGEASGACGRRLQDSAPDFKPPSRAASKQRPTAAGLRWRDLQTPGGGVAGKRGVPGRCAALPQLRIFRPEPRDLYGVGGRTITIGATAEKSAATLQGGVAGRSAFNKWLLALAGLNPALGRRRAVGREGVGRRRAVR